MRSLKENYIKTAIIMSTKEKPNPEMYKIGTGTITFVNDRTAYVRPDQTEYGDQIYVPGGIADKTCSNRLTSKYRLGDRVSFTYIKATNPTLGCKWATLEMSKLESSTKNQNDGGSKFPKKTVYQNKSAGQGNGILRGIGGKIGYNGNAYAYIDLDPPYSCRAFMDSRSVVEANCLDRNGHFSLGAAFPKSTRVVCDLFPQTEYNRCKYFAENVVSINVESTREIDNREKSIERSIDKSPNPPIDKSPNPPIDKSPNQSIDKTPNRSVDKSSNRSIDKSIDIGSATGTADRSEDKEMKRLELRLEKLNAKSTSFNAFVQTKPTLESILLKKLFDDKEIFCQISSRHPDILHQYLKMKTDTRLD